MRDFFDNKRLYHAINCTLVALAPKSCHARATKEMTPISCYTAVYKIISKVLTMRLRTVIESVVDMNQSAFIPGRMIHDNILMAKELVRGYGKKYISPRYTVQIDLQKAYDTVEWPAVEWVPQQCFWIGSS